ncbi:hypothetical protein MLD38_004130 [Melastoma candidum]|uniref:Uncharacterized protein n=1 Tax=Melastoma candidum TaxID=119954 RepID=A0ACB9S482_9MYRT|nr:hypothetical protein MLD38_004130 [Melastoma candidum]
MADVMNAPPPPPESSPSSHRPEDNPGDTITASASADPAKSPTDTQPSARSPSPLPPPPNRRRDRDSHERRDDRDVDIDRPNRSRPDDRDNHSPPPRDRDRGYKRRGGGSSASPPPPQGYRDRRRSPIPPYNKRSRRGEDGGYEGRRGSPRGGGFGHGDRRFGYDHYDRNMGGRYGDERFHGRYMGRGGGYFGGPPDWDMGRGGYGDPPGAITNQREGLMTYKQFIQVLEDDILPSEAERRYQEYKTEYITTQKRAYFDAHKNEEWLRDKYHPTNLVSVIERRNELARQAAKEFLLELQGGTLDLGPGLSSSSSNKSGHGNGANSDDEQDASGRRRHHGRGSAKETDLSSAPKAHPVSSDPRRVQIDIEQAQALVRKLDSEKGVEDNILVGSANDKVGRDKTHGSSSGPVIIIRSLTSVKGLEGIDLLDTLLTYLWRIHGLNYYGMIETSEAKGLRHVRAEGKNTNPSSNGSEWENKLDSRWQERLSGQDPLELMTAKEKIDAAAVEVLDPYVRKIRDEKYGWKYGCGAKGCTKLFHAAEFVHKHLKLKHPELVMELTSKLREELYFQNYMNDPDAPGGTPVMQVNLMRDRPQRRRPLENRLRDDRPRRDRDNRVNGSDRFDRPDNPQSGDMKDGLVGDGDDAMFDPFGGQGLGAPFGSDFPPPPVLMPVPGAGPLGPFVPAPPEVAMQMFRDQGGPPFEGGVRNSQPGPPMGGPAPIIASFPGFRQDPRRLRSYQDLDAPEDEVTVIDYRSL